MHPELGQLSWTAPEKKEIHLVQTKGETEREPDSELMLGGNRLGEFGHKVASSVFLALLYSRLQTLFQWANFFSEAVTEAKGYIKVQVISTCV